MRLRLRVARPSHQEADFTEQNNGKKTSKNGDSSSIKYADASVEVWTMDEHRVGLTNIDLKRSNHAPNPRKFQEQPRLPLHRLQNRGSYSGSRCYAVQ
jgi:hypothetical protein